VILHDLGNGNSQENYLGEYVFSKFLPKVGSSFHRIEVMVALILLE
jgi:hypothetical protein